MKKKTSLATALALTLAFAIAAIAQAANTYDISTSFSPTKTGTSARPAAVGGAFGFKVTETTGQRPAALDSLRITFNGVRLNTRFFRGCSAAAMEQAQSDAGCPAAAKMGSGFARNIAGNINNRADQSQRCYLSLNLWNSGGGKMALFVRGNPNAPAATRCPLPIATAIPVTITRRSTGDVFSFNIPQNLKTPLATIRNALVETQITFSRKTVRRSGRTRGFFETVGACRRNQRAINVRFDNEGSDTDVTQSAIARCTS